MGTRQKTKRNQTFGVDVAEGPTEEEIAAAFGEDPVPGEETPETPEAPPEEVSQETPEAPPVPGEEPVQEPGQESESSQPSESPPGSEPAEGEQAEAERLWAQKFKTPDELERSYELLQSMESRTRQQFIEQQARGQQLEAALREALPMIEELQQLRAQVAQQRQGEQREEIDTMDPASVQAYIQREIQNGIQGYIAQQQAPYQNPALPGQPYGQPYAPQVDPTQAAWDQSFNQRRAAAIDQFRRAHPDVTENSPLDHEMYKIVESFNFDPTDTEQLEMAWSIWENPQAGALLRANPHWLATPEGRSLFRQNVVSAAPGGAPANGGAPARQRPQAHVETGGSGAPVQSAPGDRPSDRDPVTGKPRDEFSDVLDEWNTQATQVNVFGLK